MITQTKNLLARLTESLLPARAHLFCRYYYQKITNQLDDEMFYIANICPKKRRFLDVGSNIGMYSYYFLNQFENIEAFEPLTDITYRLHALSSERLTVHNVAISNQQGVLEFNIPIIDGKKWPPLASLEKRDVNCEVVKVRVKTIDDFQFDDVDFIKIDVEGHEENVIKGAVGTILRCQPLLLIEIEQRHITKPISEVFASVINLGYEGFFLQKNKLISLSEFSVANHQEQYLEDVMQPSYVNNFLFTPVKLKGAQLL